MKGTKDFHPLEERKPWEDDPTGPAPVEPPRLFSVDMWKLFGWFKKKKKEKDNV